MIKWTLLLPEMMLRCSLIYTRYGDRDHESNVKTIPTPLTAFHREKDFHFW